LKKKKILLNLPHISRRYAISVLIMSISYTPTQVAAMLEGFDERIKAAIMDGTIAELMTEINGHLVSPKITWIII
jgi:hypothetical protein